MVPPPGLPLLSVFVCGLLLAVGPGSAAAADNALTGWKHAGTITLLTTPDGAHLPPTAAVTDFPVLVRMHRDWFDFTQARPDGADVRFTTAEGARLDYQVEEWDA